MRGFVVFTEAFSLAKKTALRFREGASLEVRLDAINVLNRTEYANPNPRVSDKVRFGKIFGKSDVVGPRNIQLGVQLHF